MSGQRRRMSVFFDFPRCLVFAKCFVLTPSGHADPYIVSAWYPDTKLKFKFSTYYNLVPTKFSRYVRVRCMCVKPVVKSCYRGTIVYNIYFSTTVLNLVLSLNLVVYIPWYRPTRLVLRYCTAVNLVLHIPWYHPFSTTVLYCSKFSTTVRYYSTVLLRYCSTVVLRHCSSTAVPYVYIWIHYCGTAVVLYYRAWISKYFWIWMRRWKFMQY